MLVMTDVAAVVIVDVGWYCQQDAVLFLAALVIVAHFS